jgi:hypothetical protein
MKQLESLLEWQHICDDLPHLGYYCQTFLQWGDHFQQVLFHRSVRAIKLGPAPAVVLVDSPS